MRRLTLWILRDPQNTEKNNKTAEYISYFMRYFKIDNDWNQSLVSGNTSCVYIRSVEINQDNVKSSLVKRKPRNTI